MDKFFTEGTYKLSNYCLICFDGEYDKAYDLLQGQVLSDVGHCKEEKFELSALCDEKGFILADFYISLNKNKFVNINFLILKVFNMIFPSRVY